MADTAGVKNSPEHEAFKRSQAEQGDQITREPDPRGRAELRTEREAQGHLYAAELADTIGGRALGRGQFDDAKAMGRFGELHREIAGELRSPTPPERGEAALSATEQTKADFARDAAAVSGLGSTARTVHVAEMPSRASAEAATPRQSAYEALAEVRRELEAERLERGPAENAGLVGGDKGVVEPQSYRPNPTRTRALIVGEGLGNTEIMEVYQSLATKRPPQVEAAIDQDEAKATQLAYEPSQSSKAERQSELEAAAGVAPTRPDAPRQSARQAMAEVRREAEAMREAQGPERASGHDVTRAPGHYAILAR
jgi:hypothetical protein